MATAYSTPVGSYFPKQEKNSRNAVDANEHASHGRGTSPQELRFSEEKARANHATIEKDSTPPKRTLNPEW